MSPTEVPSGGSALRSLRRYWIAAVLLTLLTSAAGVSIALNRPPTYTAEARLAVGPDSNSAYSIAGFPTAARDLAANYARWVQNNATSGTWAPEGVSSVTASPIPESGVIRIETQSTTKNAAVAGADQVSQQLLTVVTQAQADRDPKAAYQRYADLSPQVAAAQGVLDAAQSAYGRAPSSTTAAAIEKARVDLSLITLQRDAQGDLYRRLTSDISAISQLKQIAPAGFVGTDRRSKIELYGVLGFGAGVVLSALVLSLLQRRRDRREAARAEAKRDASASAASAR